jgi:putative transcriptional regulator
LTKEFIDGYNYQYADNVPLTMAIDSKTDDEILHEIGARLRAYRLQMNSTQAELADRAGVSRTTVRDAELGKDSQLSTLVKLLRALGRLGDLDAFLPAPSVSPIHLMKRQGKPRQRARKPADG